jgi:hypothetical protein
MKLIKLTDFFQNDPMYLDPEQVTQVTMAYDDSNYNSGPIFYATPNAGGNGGYTTVSPTSVTNKSNPRTMLTLKNETTWQVKEHIEIVAALVEGRDVSAAIVLYGKTDGNESKKDTPT